MVDALIIPQNKGVSHPFFQDLEKSAETQVEPPLEIHEKSWYNDDKIANGGVDTYAEKG